MDGQPENAQYSSDRGDEAGRRSPLRRLEGHRWRSVASGFLVIIPVLVTFFILKIVYDYVESIFRPAVIYWLGEESPVNFAGFGVIATLVLLYLIGSFLSGRRFQQFQDAVLTKVPVVSPIYRVARQAVDALSSPKDQHFSRVVFVDWPRPGVKAMGFVTRPSSSRGRAR